MAIYHFNTKIVSRKRGQSAVGSAAYRSATKILEETTGIIHDYSRKLGVKHAEIFAPEGAPAWVFDRRVLWNTVERLERRKDSQLARDIEVGMPIELSKTEQVALLRDYIQREFVSQGMVADLGLHLDNPHNPHAHILLSMRDLGPEGFGYKNTAWNQTAALLSWRRGWAEVTNEHLAAAGLGIRIDHRSYREQQSGLIPGRKIGVGLSRQHDERLPRYLAERVTEQQKIMAANGQQIIAEPSIALKALTHSQATFTHHEVAQFLNTRTADAEQFQAAYLKVTTAPEIVGLGQDDQGRQRFTTQAMLTQERTLFADAEALARRRGHGVGEARQRSVVSQHTLSADQVAAFEHVTGAGDLKALVGVAGSGKSTALAAMRQAWEADGYSVKGAAVAALAAQNLQDAAGIEARTVASYELAWSTGRAGLAARDVLVIDEAGMLPTRQLARVLEVANKAGAKVVLVGDPEQLQAIEAGAPFRGVAAQHGVAELTTVRRQRQEWQRTATGQLASGRTAEALAAYRAAGAIVAVGERGEARRAVLARWARDAKVTPTSSQLVLAYTRDDVQTLNGLMRGLRQQTGQLGESREIATGQGTKAFSVNDRVRFLRNDKSLGVKNGSLGTIRGFDGKVFDIQLDGEAEKRLTVDTKFYSHLDHGYAATVHKAQGATVDLTYVLATPHFDRHSAYVALSRHREDVTVFYAKADFGGRGGRRSDEEIHERMTAVLSQARPKDLAHDYLQLEMTMTPATAAEVAIAPAPESEVRAPSASAGPAPPLEALRRAGREQWRQERALAKNRSATPTPEEQQRQAVQNWLKYRAESQAKEQSSGLTPAQEAVQRWAEFRALSPEERAAREAEWRQEREQELEKKRDLGRDGDWGL